MSFKKNGNMNKTCVFVLSSVLVASSVLYNSSINVNAGTKSSLSYDESTDSFSNPERGFYTPTLLKLKEVGSSLPSSGLNSNLVHLRVDLSNFDAAHSSSGSDTELSNDALSTLDKTLKAIKSNGGTAIVRFAYDNYYNGSGVVEPSIDMIKTHINQLSSVLNSNEEVVACVESGILGVYGEVHGTNACSLENRVAVIQCWLDNLDKDITISVRTPTHYAEWLGVSTSELGNTSVYKDGMDRIGIYNDGYLGSNSDLGTYKNRADEVEWISDITNDTFFGGEMVAYYDNDTPKNTAAFMSDEGFLTHTTYLNSQWNDKAIAALKNEIYNGDDTVYNGLSGYTYVDNHLGYRFVLRNSDVKFSDLSKSISVDVDIENVGFGNLINDKITTLVLKNSTNTYEIPINDLDLRDCDSQSILSYSDVFNVSNVDAGTYNVYLRVSDFGTLETDNNYNTIRFANDASQYDSDICANLIGSVVIEGDVESVDDGIDIRDITKNGVIYKLNSNGTASVTGVSKSHESNITIVDSIDYRGVSYTVNSISSNAFRNVTDITSIELPSGLSSIGKDAFKQCFNLKNVSIKSGLSSIDDNAFNGTSISTIEYTGNVDSWKSVSISSENESINGVVVKASDGDYTIKIPKKHIKAGVYFTDDTYKSFSDLGISETGTISQDSIKSISNYSEINDIIIPEGVTSVGDYAFSGLTNLKSVKFSSTVTEVGKYAFKGCTSLTNVGMMFKADGGTLEHIGAYAFQNCTSLRYINFPDTVIYIDRYSLNGCSKEIDVQLECGKTIGWKYKSGSGYGSGWYTIGVGDNAWSSFSWVLRNSASDYIRA